MADQKQRLNEFDPVSHAEWKAVVEKDLKGASFDKRLVKKVAGGVEVQPLYTQDDAKPDAQGLPGSAPFVRGSDALGHVEMGWQIRQRESHADVREASAAIEQDLAHGCHSAWVQFDSSTRRGSGEAAGDGVIAGDVGALEVLFEGTDLSKTPVALDAGASALPVAASLLALAARRNVPATALSGWLYADPIGTLAEHGSLPGSLEAQLTEMSDLAAYCADSAPGLRAAVVRTAPYHNAGADAVAELAIAIATGIAYLRAMVDAGMTPDDAAQQIGFDFSTGRDVFVEIAKLRAARRLWSRVVEVSGADAKNGAMRIHARGSARTKTTRDPWVNLLRSTAESFSAAVGGADSIATSHYDEAIGQPDALSSRIARNTQVLLMEESYVNRVVDPAGGSWYVETLTDSIADAAWAQMQSLEADGGIAAALASGKVAATLAAGAKTDADAAAKRKLAITGVNEFPNLAEAPVERAAPNIAGALASCKQTALKAGPAQAAKLEALGTSGTRTAVAIEAAAEGASLSQLRAALNTGDAAQIDALTPAPIAGGYEALRTRSDAHLAATGKRPQVFLVNLGSIPQHKARAGFATNLLESGGIEALTNNGFETPDAAAAAFAESGAAIACVCSSDDVYAEQAEATARALVAKGAKAIVLAGKPADQAALEAAGFTHFIFMGVNVQTALESLFQSAGVSA